MNAQSELHPVVQAALDALHTGEKKAWRELFEPSAQLFDDGSPRDFSAFTAGAGAAHGHIY